MRKFVPNTGDKEIDISEEEISKHKDFSRLQTNYSNVLQEIHGKPIYKSKKGFLILFLIIVLLILMLKFEKKPESELKEKSKIENKK